MQARHLKDIVADGTSSDDGICHLASLLLVILKISIQTFINITHKLIFVNSYRMIFDKENAPSRPQPTGEEKKQGAP